MEEWGRIITTITTILPFPTRTRMGFGFADGVPMDRGSGLGGILGFRV